MRKIVKILISLLFLAVAALGAIFAVKAFLQKIDDDYTTKYGVQLVEYPIIENDNSEEKLPLEKESAKIVPGLVENNATKYGIAYRALSPEEIKELRDQK